MSSRAKRKKLREFNKTSKAATTVINTSLNNIKIIRSIYTEELDFGGKVKRLSPSEEKNYQFLR